MKLLMISGDRTLASGRQGAFYEMLKEFSKHWERIDVICPYAEGAQVPPSGIQNVFLHPCPRGLSFQRRWIEERGQELAREHSYGVMTVQEYPPFYNGLGARKLLKKIKIPAVLEIHHIVGWPLAASLSERIGYALSRLFLASHAKHFDAIRVVNDATKKKLALWGVPNEKIHVVSSMYLDHELLKFNPSAEKKYDIAFSARLVANKGLFELLKAVKMLQGVKLLVMGDGLLKPKAEVYAKQLGIADRVTFAGWLPTQSDVIFGMQSAKIFVMNSKSEGGPRVVLEAMALGLPVVATSVGVVPDVIRHEKNGMMSDGTSEDLALRISGLLSNDQLRSKLGSEAQKIKEKFEKKRLLEAYADFIKHVGDPSLYSAR